MKRFLLVIMIIILGAATACTSALSQGDRSSDVSHIFTLLSAQTIGKIDEAIAPEGDVFLVIKYRVENLRSGDDARREWTGQIKLEANEEQYQPTLVETLDNQMWATSLSAKEKQSGYIAFTVPEEIHDFNLTFTFPTSGTEETYRFRPADKRIGVNADYVLTRLEQIERTKRIWIIGRPLAAFSSSPIRYLGTILVPKEEISGLMERTEGLSGDARKAAIEDYLVEHGHCRLE